MTPPTVVPTAERTAPMKKTFAMVARATMLASLLLVIVGAAQAFAADSGYVGTGSFGAAGTGDGEFTAPKRVAVENSTGNVFVVDSGSNRVEVFSPNGGSADYLTQFGSGELSAPVGIAIDQSTGDVYVSSSGNDKIVKYTTDGAPTPTYAVDTTFTSPLMGNASGKVGSFAATLAVDPTSGDLLVADPGHNVVHRYGSDGTFQNDFDGSDTPGGAFTGLLDVAVGAAGKVYVVDSTGDIVTGGASSRALRFSGSGAYEATISGVPTPGVVTVDTNTGYVLIGGNQSAFAGSRIYAFNGTTEVMDSPYPGGNNSGSITGLAVDGGSTHHAYAVGDQVFGCCGFLGIQVLKAVPLADATANLASSVTEFAAHFSGTVNPEGVDTGWHFEYSTDDVNWTAVDADHDAGSGNSDVPVATDASGLQQNTTYHLRLVATTSDGAIRNSVEQPFSTLAVPLPDATADAPSEVSAHDATFTGTVNPHGFSTTWHFEYKPESATFWQDAPVNYADAGTGTADVPVTVDVHGLDPHTGYHVRLVAANSGGSTTSTEQTFTTEAVPPTVVMNLAPSQLKTTSAVLQATVNPNNSATTYHVEYGLTTGYGTSVPSTQDADAGSGGTAKAVAQQIAGLAPGTDYHYRVVAHDEGGTTTGEDKTFTTPTSDAPSAGAPDGRAYEMVSPVDKNGADTLGYLTDVRSSDSGDRVTFASFAAFADSAGIRVSQQYLGSRSENGWSTSALLPAQDQGPNFSISLPSVLGYSHDLSQVALRASDPAPAPGAEPGTVNLYTRDSNSGSYSLLTPAGAANTNSIAFDYASKDFSHVLFETGAKLTADAPIDNPAADTLEPTNLYEHVDGQVRLVGILPNDTPAPSGARAGIVFDNGGNLAGGSLNGFYSMHAISDDGSRIFWTDLATFQLYARLDGTQTVHVSASQRSAPDPHGTQDAIFADATPSGSKVFFISAEKLTDDSTASPGGLGQGDLYSYDVGTGQLTDLNAVPGKVARVVGFLGASTDGASVYFAASGDPLADGAAPATTNVYHWQSGVLSYVATLASFGDQVNWTTNPLGGTKAARVSSNGRYLLFSSNESLTSYDNLGHVEFYRYDAVSHQLACVSCNPSGSPATADVTPGEGAPNGVGSTSAAPFLTNIMSADGRRVFFQTGDSLLRSDTNGHVDVYEWEEGQLHLISTGQSASDSYLSDASASGDDAFFVTRQALAPRDQDNNVDLYDARVGGGFASQNLPPACSGDDCHGQSRQPPLAPTAGSVTFVGPGNAAATPRVVTRVKISKKSLRGSTLVLSVTVPAKGRISARGSGLETVSRRVSRSGTYTVKLRLTAKARKVLKHNHKLKLTVRVGYTPASGKFSSTNVSVTARA
jgi:hypothetical protein